MLMSLGVPSAGAGLDSVDLPNWIGGVNGDLSTTTFNFSRDEDSAEKITYFTQRFYGLQLGAGYVPEIAEDIELRPTTIMAHVMMLSASARTMIAAWAIYHSALPLASWTMAMMKLRQAKIQPTLASASV